MIDKGTATLCREQALPYTTVVNDTITLITDMGALAIYVYLQTKPSNWIIRAKDIQKHFGIGRDRYRSGMRFLKELGLMECRLVRNDSGQFVDTQTILHYTPIPLSLKNDPSVEDTESLKNDPPDNPTAGEPTPLVIKDSLVIKDKPNICASDDAPKVVSKVSNKVIENTFQEVWKGYHNKKGKLDAEMAFHRIVKTMTPIELELFAEKIKSCLVAQIKENAFGWSNLGFEKYLNKQRWQDVVGNTEPVKKELDMAARFPATMTQFLSGAWPKVGDMDREEQVILQWGIENGKVNNPDNIDKLTQFGFTRGNE